MQVVDHPIVFWAACTVYARVVVSPSGARPVTIHSGQERSEQPAGVAWQLLLRSNQVSTA
jgi:hypothetical protein